MAKKKSLRKKMKFAPLKGSFMVFAILGFLISGYIVFPESSNFGIALMLVFAAMFIASLVSMTKAPVIEV
jgi:hypothetical protein